MSCGMCKTVDGAASTRHTHNLTLDDEEGSVHWMHEGSCAATWNAVIKTGTCLICRRPSLKITHVNGAPLQESTLVIDGNADSTEEMASPTPKGMKAFLYPSPKSTNTAEKRDSGEFEVGEPESSQDADQEPDLSGPGAEDFVSD